MNLNNSNKSTNGLLYFLIGGGIGAAVALLFAPKSGSEMRNDITDITRKGLDETRDIAARVKSQSQDIFHNIKDRAEKVLDFTNTSLSSATDVIGKTLENTENLLEGVNKNASQEAMSKPEAGTHRKSSAIF